MKFICKIFWFDFKFNTFSTLWGPAGEYKFFTRNNNLFFNYPVLRYAHISVMCSGITGWILLGVENILKCMLIGIVPIVFAIGGFVVIYIYCQIHTCLFIIL
jgi:hypothetical protein